MANLWYLINVYCCTLCLDIKLGWQNKASYWEIIQNAMIIIWFLRFPNNDEYWKAKNKTIIVDTALSQIYPHWNNRLKVLWAITYTTAMQTYLFHFVLYRILSHSISICLCDPVTRNSPWWFIFFIRVWYSSHFSVMWPNIHFSARTPFVKKKKLKTEPL